MADLIISHQQRAAWLQRRSDWEVVATTLAKLVQQAAAVEPDDHWRAKARNALARHQELSKAGR